MAKRSAQGNAASQEPLPEPLPAQPADAPWLPDDCLEHGNAPELEPPVDPVDRVTAERDGWEDTAKQEFNNKQHYRSLLLQIGEMFGDAARTADDGSKSEDVLVAKVPELVSGLFAKHRQKTIDTAFATYQRHWMTPGLSILRDQAISELGEHGCGAIHGFLVPDGSYFNESNAQINGPVSRGDRVWMRGKGFVTAGVNGELKWPE